MLVEREWLAYGHKFGDRCGHNSEDSNQRSPVFLQWLDCVHQLIRQFPCEFQFNEAFLVGMLCCMYLWSDKVSMFMLLWQLQSCHLHGVLPNLLPFLSLPPSLLSGEAGSALLLSSVWYFPGEQHKEEGGGEDGGGDSPSLVLATL